MDLCAPSQIEKWPLVTCPGALKRLVLRAIPSIKSGHTDHRKGQEIMPNMFEEFEFYQSLDASARTVDTELMSCDLDDAPERYDPSGESSAL